MQTTMSLLERALKIAPVPVWTEKFKLTRSAISVAKASGHLTPVIAGHFAAELNEDPNFWMSLAVMEGEKESPSKQALRRRLENMRNL